MAHILLNQNRFGLQPKWSQFMADIHGAEDPHSFPLHVKPVPVIDLKRLSMLSSSLSTKERWHKVSKWITEEPLGVLKGRPYDANFTETEIKLMIAAEHIRPIEATDVKSTVNMFTIPEFLKRRRRVIKHTKPFNDHYDKDTLLGIKLIRAKALSGTVHDGKFAIHLDFSAFFDQIELDEELRSWFCFKCNGQWYSLCRLPMGMRQAVDVAQTVTDLLLDFDRPGSVRVDSYVDNVRFLGDDKEEVIECAAKLIERCHSVGVTINEVDASEDPVLAARRLLVKSGEFLGVEFDYETKRVRLGQKAIAKLSLLHNHAKSPGQRITYRHFLSIFGLLFHAMHVLHIPGSNRYYALREYSEVARRLHKDPHLFDSAYRCPPARWRAITDWIEETLDNPWIEFPKGVAPNDADFILVTDASGYGWGGLLLNAKTGELLVRSGVWTKQECQRFEKSAWSEPEAISCALKAFFPHGTRASISVLSDSSTAVGAFAKGRSSKFYVNRAIESVHQPHTKWNISFHHIPGDQNPSDAISRGKELDLAEATAQVLRLRDGLTQEDKRVPFSVVKN